MTTITPPPPRCRGILFSSPMIRVIGKDLKTQTRRVMEPQPSQSGETMLWHPRSANRVGGIWIPSASWRSGKSPAETGAAGIVDMCPYGTPGDELYVRENVWLFCERQPDGLTATERPKWRYVPLQRAGVFYAADHPEKPTKTIRHPNTGNQWGWRLKLGRFMPRWASRYRLRIQSTRVQRIRQISEEDAIAEGIERVNQCGILRCAGWRDYGNPTGGFLSPIASMMSLWDSINGDRYPVVMDPWVWAITFERIK